jgi:hypothetical protein
MNAVRKNTEATLEEIKGMREDIQPGYGDAFQAGTGRCSGDKGTPGNAVRS